MRPRFSGKSRRRYSAGGFVILQPRRLSFSMTAFTASMTADSKPAFLSAWTPSMVVPPGRGDFIDQRHRMLAGFLAELCRAERRLAGNFLR